MINYFKYHIWEWLLCVMISAALLVNLAQGFYIPDWAADSALLAVATTGGCLLYFFIGKYNKITMITFPLLFMALITGFFLMLRARNVNIGSGEGADAIYIYWIASVVISLLVFSLSRARAGIAALFLIGICLHAVIDFLAYDIKPWCVVIFTFACLCLFPLRQYRVNALRSSSVRPGFASLSLTASGAALASVAVAMLLFTFVIEPLAPPTRDIRLISRTMRYDILERIGVARNYPIPDEMLRAQPEPDIGFQAGEDMEKEPERSTEAVYLPETDFVPPVPGAALPQDADEYASVSYANRTPVVIVMIIVVFVFACVFLWLLPRLIRRRRRERLMALGREELILVVFPRILMMFKRIGLARSPAQTALEYFDAGRERISRYTQDALDFGRLTEAYLRVRFGGLSVEDDIYEGCLSFCPTFARNYRRLEGRARYLLRVSRDNY